MDLKTREVLWTAVTKEIHEVAPDYVPQPEELISFYKEGKCRDRVEELIVELRTKQIGWDEEFLLVTAKGNEKWVRVICMPEVVDGKLTAVKGSIQDIHKEKMLVAALHEKNKTVSRIFDSSIDIIAVLDKKGNRKLVSNSAVAIFGYSIGELKDQCIFNMIHPEDKQATNDTLNKIKELKSISNFENRILKKDGTWVNMSWSYWWDEEFESVYTIGRDITVNKKIEEELRLSENKFRSVIENLSVGIVKHKPTAEIMLCNDAALKMLGLTKDQLIGVTAYDPMWKIIHEDGTPFIPVDHPVSIAIASQKTVHNVVMGVYRPVTKDSVWLLVNATPQFYSDGKMECVTVTFSEITEKKKMEAEMNAQLKRYRMLMHTSQDFIHILNREGKLLEWNDSFAGHLGYSEEELALMYAWDWLPAFTKETVLKTLTDVKDEGITFDVQYLLKDGSLRSMDVKLHKFLSNNEAYFYASARDITELKQKQLEIEKLNAELRELSAHMQQLIEKERAALSKTIHDEFGQKFVAINMNAELLKRKLKGENIVVSKLVDEQIDMAHDVIRASRKLFNLLYPSMLDDLGLVAALQSCCEEHLKSSGIALTLNSNVREEKFSKEIRLTLFRIFQECLTNVILYSKAIAVNVDINAVNKAVTMCINDNGIGFDTSNINTKAHHGLLVMRERAYAMNGKFTITSTIGKGTTVEVVLPIL